MVTSQKIKEVKYINKIANEFIYDDYRKKVKQCAVRSSKALKNKTIKSEDWFWDKLPKYLRKKVQRNRPIGRYIADFNFSRFSIVVEIDGTSHNSDFVKFRDKIKDDYLFTTYNRLVLRVNYLDENGLIRTLSVLEDGYNFYLTLKEYNENLNWFYQKEIHKYLIKKHSLYSGIYL